VSNFERLKFLYAGVRAFSVALGLLSVVAVNLCTTANFSSATVPTTDTITTFITTPTPLTLTLQKTPRPCLPLLHQTTPIFFPTKHATQSFHHLVAVAPHHHISVVPKSAKHAHSPQIVVVTLSSGPVSVNEEARSPFRALINEAARIFNEARANQASQTNKNLWVSLVVDVAVCSHFAGFITSILVFLKARSLHSLT